MSDSHHASTRPRKSSDKAPRKSVFERLGAPPKSRPEPVPAVKGSSKSSSDKKEPSLDSKTKDKKTKVKDKESWTPPGPPPASVKEKTSKKSEEDETLLERKREELRKELESMEYRRKDVRSPGSLNRSGSSCSNHTSSSSSFNSSRNTAKYKSRHSSQSGSGDRGPKRGLPPNVIDPDKVPVKYDRHGNIMVVSGMKDKSHRKSHLSSSDVPKVSPSSSRRGRRPDDLPPSVRLAEEMAKKVKPAQDKVTSKSKSRTALLPTPSSKKHGLTSPSYTTHSSRQDVFKRRSDVSSPISQGSLSRNSSVPSVQSHQSDKAMKQPSLPISCDLLSEKSSHIEQEPASTDMSPISDVSGLSDIEESEPVTLSESVVKKSDERFSDWSDEENETEFPVASQANSCATVPERLKSDISSNLETVNETLEEISDDELEAIIGSAVLEDADESITSMDTSANKLPIIDVLDIDWNELHKDRQRWQERKRTVPLPGSARKRFSASVIFSTEGFSQKFAGPDLSEKIVDVCQRDLGSHFRGFLHPCGLMHKILLDDSTRTHHT